MSENDFKSGNTTFSESIEILEHEDIPKKAKRQPPKIDYKSKTCHVIYYDKRFKTLDIMFDNYGIRIKNVKDFTEEDTINIKYKGEIGKSNFEIKL